MFLVLVIVLMKKSKTALLSKYIIFIFLISLLYTGYYLNKVDLSIYHGNEKVIEGTVIAKQKTDYGYRLTVKAKEKLLVRVYQDLDFKLGNKIRITGTLTKPAVNTNFYLFNYQNYLKSEKIYWIMDAEKIKIIDKSEGAYQIKNKLVKHLETFKSSPYLKAFILGDDNSISDKVTDSYQINGISHLLAISGMQITFLAVCLLFILNLISKRKAFNYIILLSFLVFYTFITAFSPPIVRATSLFILITIKDFIKINVKTIYLLILTASLYLFYNPFIIYNIGFLFSFIISFYLLLFTNNIKEIKGYIQKTFIISFVCFLASTPILIINFHYINFLSPLLNIIFVPLVTFIIYPLAIITTFLPVLDHTFFNFCQLLENLSLFFSKFTNFILILKHINLIIFIIYYLLITFVIYQLFQKKYKLLILLFLILVFHNNINYFNKTAFLTVLDVGQGDSLFLKLPNNKGNILIDTGGKVSFSDSDYDYVTNITIPYLKAEGVNRLDYLIVTHGDYDHMGDAIKLINNFKVDKVIFNNDEYNDLEQNLIKVLKNKNIKYYQNIENLNLEGNTLYFLNKGTYDNENDNSSVIYTKINGIKLLLMGDAGIETEKDILARYNLKNIDILKVGHHGSKTSTSASFVNDIKPKYSVISVGKNNSYGHPNKEVLKNLKNSVIYRTDQIGSIKFKLNNKLEIDTCLS